MTEDMELCYEIRYLTGTSQYRAKYREFYSDHETFEEALEALERLREKFGIDDEDISEDIVEDPALRYLQSRVHLLAVLKGWWPGGDSGLPISVLDVSSRLMLVVSELSEALEELRTAFNEPGWIHRIALDGKPEGFGIELADAMIRIMDLAGALNIDLEQCILAKHEYNKTRPHRHGGKKL